MFIRVDKKVLIDATAPCLCATASRTGADIALSCLYFQTDKENGKIVVTSFDGTKGVKTEFEAFILEEGEILLDANRLHSIVRSLPDGEIAISSDEKNVTAISSGSTKFEILGLPGQSFPAMPLLSGEKKMTLSQGVLKKMLQQVIFACAMVELKPILTGVLFEAKEDSVRLCGCDGYRIALRDEKLTTGIPMESQFVVPAKSLLELIKLLSDDEEESIWIELARRHIIFAFDEFVFFSRYVDGEYIDYRKSLPNGYKTKVTINLTDLIRCFERCSLLIDERAKSPVCIDIGGDLIHVTCRTANGSIDESLPCEIEGENVKIGFNNKFLLDAFRGALNCGDEEVILELNSALSGMVIHSPEKDNYYYMVIPMRLN